MNKLKLENVTLVDILVLFMAMFMFGTADAPFNSRGEGFAFIPALVIVIVICAVVVFCYKKQGIPSLIIRLIMSLVYADFVIDLVVKPLANDSVPVTIIAFIVFTAGFALLHGVQYYLKYFLKVKKERDTNVEIPPEERN